MNTESAHEHRLDWMTPRAPYMPIASVGLLRVIADRDRLATLRWKPGGEWEGPALVLGTTLDIEEVASAIAAAPWPHIEELAWGGGHAQAIKPTLDAHAKESGEPLAAVREWRSLAGLEDGGAPPGSDGSRAARELIAALLTDGVLDGSELPGRSRLLRGVKADLSGVTNPPELSAAELQLELEHGPVWRSGSSGLGLGFAPQVQTFGGTTGPEPSTVGAFSGLLYRLCWHGLIAMPPFGARPGPQPVVGGPLFSSSDTLSWVTWEMPLTMRPLVAVFGLDAIHRDDPDPVALRAHGISGVFRSTARRINTMISVFGWADEVI